MGTICELALDTTQESLKCRYFMELALQKQMEQFILNYDLVAVSPWII